MRSAGVVVPLALLCAACAAPPRPAAAPPAYDVRRAVARLVLPPDESARAITFDLRTEAQAGDQAARLAWALFLMDLFDHARFGGAPASRKLLFEELGGSAAAPGGEVATEWVVQRLDEELRRCPGPDAAAARALLAVDAGGPGADRLRLLATARRLARDGASPVRVHALLRLYGFCARALRDACQAPYPERASIANQCLYALYDSDPAAYFADEPMARPPDPPWTAYRDGLARLLDEVGRTGTRLAGVAERLAAVDRRFFADVVPGALPMAFDVARLDLPEDPTAAPWDHSPLARLERDGISLGGRAIVDDTRLKAELAVLVTADPRRRLAVLAGSDEPASRVLRLAEAARAAGARVLELCVMQRVELVAPPGDYWSGRSAARLAVLPVSLGPLMQGEAGTPREGPRAALWDPARDEVGLTLTVDQEWVLSGRDGPIARLVPEPAALRAALRHVQRAYPDQSALAIAVGDRPRYRDLVALVQALVRDARGAPLMPALGLTVAAPKGQGNLQARIARRAAAEATVAVAGAPPWAALLAPVAPQLRRCYLGVLDRSPRLQGTMVFEARADAKGRATVRAVGGLADAALRGCARERLEQALKALPPDTAGPARITVQVGVAPAPPPP